MSYQGGSMISGSLLEILHEFEVKNCYNARQTQKKIEEHRKALKEQQDALTPPNISYASSIVSVDNSSLPDNNFVLPEVDFSIKLETDSIIPLD